MWIPFQRLVSVYARYDWTYRCDHDDEVHPPRDRDWSGWLYSLVWTAKRITSESLSHIFFWPYDSVWLLGVRIAIFRRLVYTGRATRHKMSTGRISWLTQLQHNVRNIQYSRQFYACWIFCTAADRFRKGYVWSYGIRLEERETLLQRHLIRHERSARCLLRKGYEISWVNSEKCTVSLMYVYTNTIP